MPNLISANTNTGSSAGGMPSWAKALTGGAALFGAGNIMSSDDDDGMSQLNQISNMLPQYFQPYISQGQAQYPMISGQYSQLMTDPSAVINKIGAGYKQSPGYQFSVDQATKAANRAAAASGMAGSPEEQASLAKTVTGLSTQDYNNYLSHALGLYGRGLSGAQGLYNTGFQASRGLGEDLAQALMSEASLANAQSQTQSNDMGDIVKAIPSLVSLL